MSPISLTVLEHNPEEAITSMCAMIWFFAFVHDKNLVESTRLQRVPHKTSFKEEDGQWRVNKSRTCSNDLEAFTEALVIDSENGEQDAAGAKESPNT